MNNEHRLSQKEWVVIFIFLALLGSLICIAYLSDVKVSREIEAYMNRSQ